MIWLLKSSNAYILPAAADSAARLVDEINKEVISKNCAPFADCMSEINNTQVDNAKDLNVLIHMYNLQEYTDNDSRTSAGLWQYYRDESQAVIPDSESFKSKARIRGSIPAVGNIRDVEIAVPLKYLSNFWGTLEVLLINFKINLILTYF